MTPPAGSKLGVSRLIGGVLGVIALLCVLGFLAVAGTVIWMFNVALPNHARETAEAAREMARGWGAEARDALALAAADGRLTDNEIRAAVGGPIWDAERAPDRWTVRVEFPAGDGPLCFKYAITLPLGPGTDVTATELPDCPVITPG